METVTFTSQGIHRLGKRLREYRESKGWSMRAASDFLADTVPPGISASAIGDIERGAVTIKAETLLLLSQCGYGGMTFSEMINVLTEHRLSLCEKGTPYETA